jgi:hypothetical protein
MSGELAMHFSRTTRRVLGLNSNERHRHRRTLELSRGEELHSHTQFLEQTGHTYLVLPESATFLFYLLLLYYALVFDRAPSPARGYVYLFRCDLEINMVSLAYLG